jgi:hypothetical protein
MAEGRYVYCVVPAEARVELGGAPGVGGAIELLRDGDLAAVTCRVPLAEFGAEPLERNLNDLDWLGRTARAHQEVLDRALAAGPVVPLRLCTVFADESHVRAMLDRERDVLTEALARLRDRAEWGVKLIADPDRVSEPAADASGRAYLERRSRERRAHEDAYRLAHEVGEEVHARLRQEATAATLLRPQSRELSGRSGEMVLNGAYLVDRAHVERFRAAAAELGERHRPRGLVLEVTGPWPPYNFVAPEP